MPETESSTRLKKVLFVTDSVLNKTGFGRNARLCIEHLWKTGKYEIVHACMGTVQNHPDLARTPWKSIGLVNIQQVGQIKNQNDPKNWEGVERAAGYGIFQLDEIVKSERPDIVLLIQDIWGIAHAVSEFRGCSSSKISFL
jgi:hypothetical protein